MSMNRRFWVADECGAVSADWMALGAGLIAFSMALVASLSGGAMSLGTTTGAAMNAAQVAPLGEMGQ
jgi:hypothetical protein